VQTQTEYDELIVAAAMLPDTANITYPAILSPELVIVERINSQPEEYPIAVPSEKRVIRIWRHKIYEQNDDGRQVVISAYAFGIHREREYKSIQQSAAAVKGRLLVPREDTSIVDRKALPAGHIYSSPTYAGWAAVNVILGKAQDLVTWSPT
jgi:hypothetical protein